MPSPTTIYLLRKDPSTNDAADKTHDDRIYVLPVGEYLRVKYVEEGKKVIHRLYIAPEDFPRYIANLGWMYLKDTDPFHAIQFNFPGFPSVLLGRKQLRGQCTQDALKDMADMVVRSYASYDNEYDYEDEDQEAETDDDRTDED
jgi:hypothetical protein